MLFWWGIYTNRLVGIKPPKSGPGELLQVRGQSNNEKVPASGNIQRSQRPRKRPVAHPSFKALRNPQHRRRRYNNTVMVSLLLGNGRDHGTFPLVARLTDWFPLLPQCL